MSESDQKIVCPHCGREFPLSDALAHKIEERFRAQVKLERERAAAEARSRAREEMSIELRDSRATNEELRAQLRKKDDDELQLRRRARELEERERALKVELARQLDEERGRLVDDARRQAAEESELRLKQKEKQIQDLVAQMDDLKRRAQQGSQQAQGEILEIELEHTLQERFPEDEIVPVPKGRRGADLLQRVRKSGQVCGVILWEAKRTKAWGGDWLAKLKDDRDGERADVAALVSTVLPREVRHVGLVDGVWVCDFPSVIGTAGLLRKAILETFAVRQAMSGRAEKKELLYNYLSSPEFAQRIEGLVETFREMKRELEQEKAAFTRMWAKREKHLDQFMEHTARMYGDMQGIFGAGLPEIPGLSLPGAEQLPLLGDGGDDER